MKPLANHNTASILRITFLLILPLFIVDGCKENSGPTGPFDPPTYPNVTGHWTGTGSWWDGISIHASWTADFVRQTDSTFDGTMIDSYTPRGATTVHSLKWYVKGTLTMSGVAVITQTSMEVVRWTSSPFTLPYARTYSPCRVTPKGDTTTYNGPGPQPSETPETFLLVKQK